MSGKDELFGNGKYMKFNITHTLKSSGCIAKEISKRILIFFVRDTSIENLFYNHFNNNDFSAVMILGRSLCFSIPPQA